MKKSCSFETCQDTSMYKVGNSYTPQILHSKRSFQNVSPKGTPQHIFLSSIFQVPNMWSFRQGGKTRKMPPINRHNFWPRSLCVANAARSQRKHEAMTSDRSRELGRVEPGKTKFPIFCGVFLVGEWGFFFKKERYSKLSWSRDVFCHANCRNMNHIESH